MGITNCENCKYKSKMKSPKYYGFCNGDHIYEGECYVEKRKWYQKNQKGKKYFNIIECIKS